MDFEAGAGDNEISGAARAASGRGVTASRQGLTVSGEDGAADDHCGTAFGQEPDFDGAGRDDDDTKSLASTDISLSELPICMPDDPPRCFMCSQKADSITPLVSSKGYRPWVSYTKVKQAGKVAFRKPCGRICSICRNVYHCGGFATRYGSLANYKILMSKKDGKQLHAEFLAALKDWIRQHNEDPERTKLKSKRRLLDAQRSLTVEREVGGKFKAPKKNFVLVDAWDPVEDGEFDESKVVEQKVFGKVQKGIWVLKGKKGHYEFEEHDGTLMREKTREEEGCGDLVDMAIEAKKEVLHGSFNKARENRDAIAIEAPRFPIADLFAMVDGGNIGTASGQDAAPASGQECGEEDSPQLIGISDEEEDLKDADEATRLSDVFSSGVSVQGKPKGQPQGKAKHAQAKRPPSQKARPQAMKTASGQDGQQSASHTPTHQPRPQARKSPQSATTASGQADGLTFKLDGRGERMRQSAQDTRAAMERKLLTIKFDECQDHVMAITGAALDEFKVQLKAKAMVAAEIKGAVKTMVGRLEKSVQYESGVFEADIAAFTEILRKVAVVMDFLQFMRGGAALDLTDAMATIDEMQRLYELGNIYTLRIFEVKVQMAMTYQDAKKACGLMTVNSEEAKSLMGTLSPEQFAAFVRGVTDDIVIGLLGDVKVLPNGITIVKPANRQQLQDLFDAASGQDNFLVPNLPEYLETSLPIINCRSVHATALGQALARVDAYSEVPMEEKEGSESLILQFFLTKGAGEDLLTVAQGVYAERKDETINETSVMENVNSSRAFQDIRGADTIDLDKLLKHVDGTIALLTRTKAQKPLNTTQKSTVQTEFNKLRSFVTAWATEELKRRVFASIRLSLEAIAKDSVTVSDQAKQRKEETGTVSDQFLKQDKGDTVTDQDHAVSDQAQQAGPVPLIYIQELLAAKELCTHSIWQRERFKGFKDRLAQHVEQSASMYKIMEYSLIRLKVYEAARRSEQVDAGSLVPTLDNVEQWLLSIDLHPTNAVDEWKRIFVQPVLNHVHEDLNATCASIKSAIHASKEEGTVAAFSDEMVKGMTAPINDKICKRFLNQFFSAMASFEKAQAKGPLCSAEEQRVCEGKMRMLLKWWPKDNLELYEKCGVGAALKERVEGLLTKLRTLTNSTLSELQDALNAQIDAAEKIQETLSREARCQASFCGHMKKHGKNVAETQAALHAMCERVKSDFPDILTSGEKTASGQDAGTASGEVEKEGGRGTAFGQLKTAYVACKTCEETCYYYTCMYVALILLRNPTTAKAGSDSHQKLGSLIGTMSSVQNPPQIFPAELAAMRKLVSRPGETGVPPEAREPDISPQKRLPSDILADKRQTIWPQSQSVLKTTASKKRAMSQQRGAAQKKR